MAAQAAAQAACGHGVGADALDEATRAELLDYAYDTLRRELRRWETHLKSDAPHAAAHVARALTEWRPSFLVTRYGDAFDRMPQAEQERWKAFWGDVDVLFRRAKTGK